MSDALTSPSPNLLSEVEASDMAVGAKKLAEFRQWANLELDKIQLSARLLGVFVAYMPFHDGRKIGMLERVKDDAFGAACHVRSEPLMGQLFFFCDQETMLKIRIPGMTAEYRHYDYNGQERQLMLNEAGDQGYYAYGPHRYEIHHSTGNDLIP